MTWPDVRRRWWLEVFALRGLAASLLVLAAANSVRAQPVTSSAAWPAKPIRLLLGFPPGGVILVGPAGLPEPVVQRLANELAKVLAVPDVKRRLNDAGAEPRPRSPQQFAAYVKAESDRWSTLIAKRGIARE